MPPDRYVAYPGSTAIACIGALANVEHAAWMQDWPIEVADPSRVREFLQLYQTQTLDVAAKRALMALVVCSFDEGLPAGDGLDWDVGEVWIELRESLVANAVIHAGLIIDWSCVEEQENGRWVYELEEHSFYAAPRMRAVLEQVRGTIGFLELDPEHPPMAAP